MDATVIIPYDEGAADTDGYISGGIRVIAGRLTSKQIEDLLVEPAYPQRAVTYKHTSAGELVAVRVTYSNDPDAKPNSGDAEDSAHEWRGLTFDDSPGRGHLSYEVRFTKLEHPPGIGFYMLTSTWEEPCEGSSVDSCRLTHEEAAAVDAAIAWLTEQGGSEIGSTLPTFDLTAEPELIGVPDLDGLGAVLDHLKLHSRYDEDPSYYGPERYGPFEARNRALKEAAARKRLGDALPPFEGSGEMGG